MTQVPTVGRIVHYAITEQEATEINRRRATDLTAIRDANAGYIAHVGNHATEGHVFPLIITRVWGTTPDSAVNGQLLLDGNDTLWVTSATVGVGPHHFAWPDRT